ncbi:hypothetical protein Droror1_Dr00020758 [Drosera rotundifolia]
MKTLAARALLQALSRHFWTLVAARYRSPVIRATSGKSGVFKGDREQVKEKAEVAAVLCRFPVIGATSGKSDAVKGDWEQVKEKAEVAAVLCSSEH